MAQNPASPPLPRSEYHPSAAGDDLDALLDLIVGDDPGPRREHAALAPREGAGQRSEESHVEQGDDTAGDLRSQLRALALQVQALSEATALQGQQSHAIQELRQAVREMAAATQQQAPLSLSSFNAELQLPSLQIKLVLAQAANLLHQADKEAAVLGSWSMLFAGLSVGTLLSIASAIQGPYTTLFWIYLAVGAFAVLVSLVFAFLTRRARRRAAEARRAMDETALTRTIPVSGA